ncbi:biotin--[acetyl-CoA-carboxylase] ligase [Flavobacteriaceae bacterium]|nr:biotin--[acetyl-CoA-carboxylase] ligase [Flavobacteriaceae bacterium]
MSYFQISKIDAIGSTNVALKDSYQQGVLKHGDVLWARNQTQGKGQRAAKWLSEPNKNLTFSLFVRHNELSVDSPFQLNCLIALALRNTLNYFTIPAVTIKWPNDILSENKKLCGVLIENLYRGTQLKASIVGIGLNVNQENFQGLVRASSMRLCSGVQFDIKEVFDHLLAEIENYIKQADTYSSLLEKYNEALFGRKELRLFRKKNQDFSATIIGVNQDGYMELEDTKGMSSLHRLKEIEWVY